MITVPGKVIERLWSLFSTWTKNISTTNHKHRKKGSVIGKKAKNQKQRKPGQRASPPQTISIGK
jgi:hypothetical protein